MRLTTVRLFGHCVYLPLIIVALVEGLIIWGASVWALSLDPVLDTHAVTLSAAIAIVSLATVGALGLYRTRFREGYLWGAVRLSLALCLSVGGALVVLREFGLTADAQTALAAAGAVVFPVWALLHAGYLAAADRDVLKRRILVVGSGKTAAAMLDLRRRADRRGFTLTGFVPTSDGPVDPRLENRTLQREGRLRELAEKYEIDEVVVAEDERRDQLPVSELADLRLAGTPVIEAASFFEREAGKIRLDLVSPAWLAFGTGYPYGKLRRVSKRTLDIVAGLLLLLVLWPVMLAAFLAVKIEDGWSAPALYRQWRTGLAGKPFQLLKFRSMRVDAEKGGKAQWASRDDPRVTRVGAFMRKSRIDELPQLFNVLRGDMSFVGPRPERPEFVAELEQSIPFYAERHRVKPGVTGWAQLNFPYGASRDDTVEKLQYDLYYLKNQSLLLDLVILLNTVEVVLFGKGAR